MVCRSWASICLVFCYADMGKVQGQARVGCRPLTWQRDPLRPHSLYRLIKSNWQLARPSSETGILKYPRAHYSMWSLAGR